MKEPVIDSEKIIPPAWIILAAAVITVTILPGFNHGIWKPDEPLVAGICAEMSRTKDFVVPRVNTVPFLEKPPLYYAAAALSGMIFGPDNEGSFRLASAVFGLLSLLLTFAIARKRSGTLQGLLAAGILASSWQFFMVTRWIQVDSALVFTVTLSMYAYVRMKSSSSFMNPALLGIAIGLSFLVKGFVGPAITAAMILGDMIFKRDFSVIRALNPVIILAFTCIVILPWITALYLHGGWPFVREVIVVNNIMRFLGLSEGAALGHQHGVFYYLISLPRNLLPWTFIFIPVIVSGIKNIRKDPYAIWFLASFILLSISSTKRSVYLAPLYPVMACMIAHWMTGSGKKTWETACIRITWVLAIICCFTPLSGIVLGRPVLGTVMAVLATGFFFTLRKHCASPANRALALVMVTCIVLSANMSVYFSYMKPREDYLPFIHEALNKAGEHNISIYLGEDEILEGLFPMITGKTYAVTSNSHNLGTGLYAWVDKRDRARKELSAEGALDILIGRDIGTKKAYLALFQPGHKEHESAPLTQKD